MIPVSRLAHEDHRVSFSGLGAMGWDEGLFAAWLVRQAGREADEEKMRK